MDSDVGALNEDTDKGLFPHCRVIFTCVRA